MFARHAGNGAKRPAQNQADPEVAAPMELPAALANYNVAFEFAIDCQLITDLYGIIVAVNHAGTKFLRAQKEFLVGKPLGLLFSSPAAPNPFYNQLARFNAGQDSCSFESLLAHPGQAARSVLVTGVIQFAESIHWIIHDTTRWKEAEASRLYLVRQLITTQSDERRRLARDLHDNAGQLLTGLSFALDAIDRGGGKLSSNARDALSLAQDSVRQLRQSMHKITHDLRSSLLDDARLNDALENLIAEWQAFEPSIKLSYQADLSSGTLLPREVEVNVYAIIQEALTNVFRHARARHVVVSLTRPQGHLAVCVTDDGVGFNADLVAHQTGIGRLGLVGMRERAELMGGAFEVMTNEGNGTKISVHIPLPASP